MIRRATLVLCVVLFGCLLFSGCKKSDDYAPSVVLTGSQMMYVPLNAAFVEPGAKGIDDVDKTDVVVSDVTPTNPNVNLTGTYIITYTSLDNAGNTGHSYRYVIVQNEAA